MGCVTDLAPPLSPPVSPSPQARSRDPAFPCVSHSDCGNAVATSALLLENFTMKHAQALLRAMTSWMQGFQMPWFEVLVLTSPDLTRAVRDRFLPYGHATQENNLKLMLIPTTFK